MIETYHTLHAEGHVSFSDERTLVALVERRPEKMCEKRASVSCEYPRGSVS